MFSFITYMSHTHEIEKYTRAQKINRFTLSVCLLIPSYSIRARYDSIKSNIFGEIKFWISHQVGDFFCNFRQNVTEYNNFQKNTNHATNFYTSSVWQITVDTQNVAFHAVNFLREMIILSLVVGC